MPEILQYTFMRKALFVGLLVGILCPTIGTFLVLRRFSMVGDTLAHVALAGVLLGILWGINPLPLA
ncbi:MAG TPA: metal ABC transporter permease, partial [Clostridia bacterium]|nr:metal ABC transporter permease [Clostridia bacterium]